MTEIPVPATLRPWRDWYQTAAWRRRRAHQLKIEPLCRMCLARGVTTPASIADHIESHGGNWNLFRLGALQSLCANCHNSQKRLLENYGWSPDIDDDGWPTDPRHPANVRR